MDLEREPKAVHVDSELESLPTLSISTTTARLQEKGHKIVIMSKDLVDGSKEDTNEGENENVKIVEEVIGGEAESKRELQGEDSDEEGMMQNMHIQKKSKGRKRGRPMKSSSSSSSSSSGHLSSLDPAVAQEKAAKDPVAQEKATKDRQEKEKRESALAEFIQQLNAQANASKEKQKDANKDEEEDIVSIVEKIGCLQSGYDGELLSWEDIARILYEAGGENTSLFSNILKEVEKEKLKQIYGKPVMKYLFVDDSFEVYNETCNIFSLEDFLSNQQFSKDTLEAEARACRGNRLHKVDNDQDNGNRSRDRIVKDTLDAKPKYLKRLERKRKADAMSLNALVSNRLQQMKQ